jgi:ketosteroid isomerase-like protein
MPPEELRARARRLIEEVLNQGDLAVASELMSPTCTHHVPGRSHATGLASLGDWLSRTHRIFADFYAIVEEDFAAGDRVAQRITAYGVHAATGRPVEFGCLQVAVAGPDGRFTELWCSADLIAVLSQLSVAPAALREAI